MTQKANGLSVTVNKLPATLPAGIEGQKILVVGQKLATGNAVAGVLVEGIEESDIQTKFGQGSMLQGQLDTIFKIFTDSGSNVVPRIDVIPLDDGAGASATSDIVISASSGTEATVSGTAVFTIAGIEYKLSITIGETIADIGARLETLLTDLDAPFSVSELTNTVSMTARNKGTVGNSFPVILEGIEYDGSAWTIGNVAFVINVFTSGATDPTLTDVLDVVEDVRYQTCLAPLQYGTDFLVEDFLDTRWNTTNKILDGVAIYADTDTKANLITEGEAINSQNLVIVGNEVQADDNFVGDLTKIPSYLVACQIGAYRSLRLTEGANIINFTPASTYGALDGEGGAHIASLPYFETKIKDIDPLPIGNKGFKGTAVTELNTAGISIIGNDDIGTDVVFGTMVTPYKTDDTFKKLNIVDTMSVSAEIFYRHLKLRYQQSRLTDGETSEGYSIANAQQIKGEMAIVYKQLAEIQLVPKGQAFETYFYNNIAMIVDLVAGKVTQTDDLPIVLQLRELLTNLKTKFGI